jgi:UDP-N-acetylmuramate dehydrogenase
MSLGRSPRQAGRGLITACQPGRRACLTCLVTVTEQTLLADHTTLRLGGPAGRFVRAANDADLIAAVRAADAEGEPVLVLGGGSNLVVPDEGFPGVVVQVATAGVQITPGAAAEPSGAWPAADSGDQAAVTLTAAAGENWDDLVVRAIGDGLAGVECLSGIPGLTGATPIQNVGAYGQEVSQTIVSVRAFDRVLDTEVELPAAECGFGYRTSAFKRRATASRGTRLNAAAATGRHVVLAVTFRLLADPLSWPVRYGELARLLRVREGDRVPLADARAAVLELRRGKGMVLDPADLDTRSAGSFFTNPVITQGQLADLEAALAGRADAVGAVPHYPAADGLIKVPAGWLIEQAGFGRGYPAGDLAGARISTKHTLALTSRGGSTADLLRLAREVRDGVQAAFGIRLENEPVLVGAEL